MLDDREEWTKLMVKAELAGKPDEHLGECAVIAVSKHRSGVAIIDDRAARKQAGAKGVECRDTLWIVPAGSASGYEEHRNEKSR